MANNDVQNVDLHYLGKSHHDLLASFQPLKASAESKASIKARTTLTKAGGTLSASWHSVECDPEDPEGE